MYINYQMYDFSDKLSFFVCTKSSRSRNLESIGSIIISALRTWNKNAYCGRHSPSISPSSCSMRSGERIQRVWHHASVISLPNWYRPAIIFTPLIRHAVSLSCFSGQKKWWIFCEIKHRKLKNRFFAFDYWKQWQSGQHSRSGNHSARTEAGGRSAGGPASRRYSGWVQPWRALCVCWAVGRLRCRVPARAVQQRLAFASNRCGKSFLNVSNQSRDSPVS